MTTFFLIYEPNVTSLLSYFLQHVAVLRQKKTSFELNPREFVELMEERIRTLRPVEEPL